MRRLIICLGLLLLGQPLYAAQLGDRVQEEHLANGLTLIMLERHEAPTVSAFITFRVGSSNEGVENRGVAHLLEHMLFKGTKTLGTRDYAAEEPILEKIEAVGSRIDLLKNDPGADAAELEGLRERLHLLQQQEKQYVVKGEFSRIYAENGGVGYNAFTGKDQTTYLISLPANKLELWASIESDRLKNAVLREFYTEREVVREERRRSYDSNPSGLLYEALISSAFKVHPYRNPVIGWDSDIENLSIAEARDFFKRYYRPVNMVITLVGDFEARKARALVDRYFSSISPGVPVPRVVALEPPQQGERRVTVNFDAEPALLIAFHKPAMPHMDDYCADVLTDILAGGSTSRLYKRLVIEEQLASNVQIYGAPGNRYANLLVIDATPRFPHSAAEVEAAIYAELDKLKVAAVSTAELKRARNRLITNNLRQMRSNKGLAGLLSSYAALGDWHYLIDYADKLQGIDPPKLIAFANRYLTSANRTVAVLQREVK
ncbi:M16 family metallopeptidase [Geopsychrobacter electrodiphilus]|uniref:M16 family metallopeptidase n=1 Tax=Geopsychrobacter electrodiphilus TaxID=225196 RepID=UPI00037CDC1A|nr:pitrilysin family protein [Geopsychrobacter electrodiphilus]